MLLANFQAKTIDSESINALREELEALQCELRLLKTAHTPVMCNEVLDLCVSKGGRLVHSKERFGVIARVPCVALCTGGRDFF